MSQKLKPILSKLAHEYNLTEKQISKIVNSPYLFTKRTVDELDLDSKTESEFETLKTNFIYKYIGKLYTSHKVVSYGKKKINILNKLKNK